MKDYLKDIIEQIIEIDTLAFANKTKNEQTLFNKKQDFENMMSAYRDEKLTSAKNKAQDIAEETDAFIIETEKSHKEQIQKISASIDKDYSRAETELIQKIFNKLFVLEG